MVEYPKIAALFTFSLHFRSIYDIIAYEVYCMREIGFLLKEHRQKCNYSLKDVANKTGISDSRLSRIEKKEICPSIEVIKILSDCYKVPLLFLLQRSGYIPDDSPSDKSIVFQNSHLLNDEEYEHIQNEINLLTKGRK